MGMFAATANVDYLLSLADQGKHISVLSSFASELNGLNGSAHQ
jgi:hypothetical protein